MRCAPYRPWLIERGSLTQKLQQRYADFAVQPVFTGYQKAVLDEQKSLHLTSHHRALVREVLLFGNHQAVVFAHSVLPRHSIRGAWHRLGKLGNQSLGATLFANQQVKRTPLSYKKLSARHPLYQRAVQHVAVKPPYVWARRSTFSLKRAQILVTEIFLPTICHA